MRNKKLVCMLLCFAIMCSFFSGCSFLNKKSPELGKWHAEVKLSEMSETLPDDYQFVLSLIAGSVAFEVDVEFFDDGTFLYIMNADKLKESISDSVSTVAGLFIQEDVSKFTDGIIEAVIERYLFGSDSECNGTYVIEGNTITANADNKVLKFEIKGKHLFQLDSNGELGFRFSKVNEEG